jgi:hypothetical protein
MKNLFAWPYYWVNIETYQVKWMEEKQAKKTFLEEQWFLDDVACQNISDTSALAIMTALESENWKELSYDHYSEDFSISTGLEFTLDSSIKRVVQRIIEDVYYSIPNGLPDTSYIPWIWVYKL